MGSSVVAQDPSGAEWTVTRQWFSRRPRRHRPRRSFGPGSWRDEWDMADLIVLPLVVLGLPEALLQAGVVAAGVLAVTIVVPTWLIGAATGWPWIVAGVVWLALLTAITIGHPLLRVPFRRPWLVVALRSDQGWADRSAWQVRGWRRSLDAVASVGDAVRSGRGPQLSAEYLL